jgi:tight adherence protein C
MRAVALGTLVGLLASSSVAPLRGSGLRPSGSHRASCSAWRLRTRDRVAAGVASLAVVAVLLPPAAPLLLLAWWTRRRVRARRAEQAHRRRVRHALPDLVDLLILAGSAGMSLPVAHPLVADHTPAPVGPALVAAHDASLLGRPRADALLAELAPLGDRAHALAHVLVDHLRYGVPLLPGLERTGLELRLERRRRAELEARRVPVRLLAPLVTCVLPAFALLTVVPLLAASLEALPT